MTLKSYKKQNHQRRQQQQPTYKRTHVLYLKEIKITTTTIINKKRTNFFL